MRERSSVAGKNRWRCRVPRRYLRTLGANFQCIFVGLSMNWDNCWTARQIDVWFGHGEIKQLPYCSPILCRIGKGISSVILEFASNKKWCRWGFSSKIPASIKISVMNFCWEMYKPLEDWCICIPRKYSAMPRFFIFLVQECFDPFHLLWSEYHLHIPVGPRNDLSLQQEKTMIKLRLVNP